MEATDKEVISRLTPFTRMDEDALAAALAQAEIRRLPKGRMIFRRAEKSDRLHWLVSGAIDLVDERFDAQHCRAGEDLARRPLDDNSPHRLTAITAEDSRILVCRREALAMRPEGQAGASATTAVGAPGRESPDRKQPGGAQQRRARPGTAGPGTAPADDSPAAAPLADRPLPGKAWPGPEQPGQDDWMSRLLSSPLFEFIPPVNIQQLFGRFEMVRRRAGDAVITQGEPGDCFYVLRAGRAKVERCAGGETALLAELAPGDDFGQDALISDAPRNATVTMTSDGVLMRLAKPDFQALLMNPVIEAVTEAEVQEMTRQGGQKVVIIDVRTPEEAEQDRVPESRNLPLPLLRDRLGGLQKDAMYCMVCDGGKRAELAAFQLNQAGFTACVLRR